MHESFIATDGLTSCRVDHQHRDLETCFISKHDGAEVGHSLEGV